MAGKVRTENRLSVHSYYRYHSLTDVSTLPRFRGTVRVIVFCFLTILLPCTLLLAPLYIRYYLFDDVLYNLGESDLVTVDKPISTFWCEGQDLWMNATFHAYLLDEEPTISEDLEHFEMDKHIQLADDSLEYWGFFLLQGSKVILSVCSRYEGARLMVVKGTKNLKHCALLDPPSKTDTLDPWEDDVSAEGGEIKVEFHSGEKPEREETARKEFGLRRPKKNQVLVQTVMLPALQNSTGDAPDMANRNATRRKYRRKPKVTANDTSTIRVKRNVTDDEGSYEYFDPDTDDLIIDDEGEEEEGDVDDNGGAEDDEEEAPNPVGVEPDEMETEKPAGSKKLKSDRLEDEEIDEEDIRSSGSSFAKNLWTCYGGDTLFTQSFTPSPRCSSQDSMMKYAVRMRTVHEITSTGYYYYIFYSDNDVVSNTIYAKFEINKVLYQLPNFTQSCVNATSCSLPLNFWSSEKVLLEVPLQDGVSDEDALAQMILLSTCRPRLAVYFFFPVCILFLILCCAFI